MIVRVGGVPFGDGTLRVVAGPCAVESEARTLRIAAAVKAAGADALRGGAFKPRTAPGSFQGLGAEGLRILALARAATGLPIVTEAMDEAQLEQVAAVADCVQVGARNMQNFPLLRAVGRLRLPVLLKRGPAATLSELLGAADYVLAGGNDAVILCERGVRSFDPAARYLLDAVAVAALRELTSLPVIGDPSHAAGRRALVEPGALALAATGADGLIVEVHDEPDLALSDGPQALLPEDFARLAARARRVHDAVA